MGQLAVLDVERPRQHLEGDHPLEGRQEPVGAGHQGGDQVAQPLRREVAQLRLLLVVGPDQQGVVVAVVAHQEGLADGLEVAEEVLDARRGDGLAGAVLVDLLLAADDAEVPVLHGHQVAGVEPAVGLVRAGLLRPAVQVAGRDVDAADHQLAVVGPAALDAGEGNADRAVHVAARRRHGDAAGGLGHAVAGAELDAGLVEVLEDHRVEVACRREAVAQPGSGDDPQVAGGLDLVLGGRLPGGRLLQLDPLLGDRDEDRRLDGAEVLQQRDLRGGAGEGVGGAPPEGAQQLQPPPEGVVERQVAEEDVPLAHLRQREATAEPLRDQVLVGEDDGLGLAGGARGVHGGGHVGGLDPRGAGRPQRLVEARALTDHLVEREQPVLLGAGRVEGHHRLQVGQAGQRGEHLGDLLLVRGQQHLGPGVLQHVDHLLGHRVGREREVHEPVGEAGQIAQRRLEAVLREDGHPDLGLVAEDGQQAAGDGAGPASHLGDGQLGGVRADGADGHHLGIGLLARGQQLTDREVGAADQRQQQPQPGIDLRRGQRLGEAAAADAVEERDEGAAGHRPGELHVQPGQERGHQRLHLGQVARRHGVEGVAGGRLEGPIRDHGGRPARGQARERGLGGDLDHCSTSTRRRARPAIEITTGARRCRRGTGGRARAGIRWCGGAPPVSSGPRWAGLAVRRRATRSRGGEVPWIGRSGARAGSSSPRRWSWRPARRHLRSRTAVSGRRPPSPARRSGTRRCSMRRSRPTSSATRW